MLSKGLSRVFPGLASKQLLPPRNTPPGLWSPPPRLPSALRTCRAPSQQLRVFAQTDPWAAVPCPRLAPPGCSWCLHVPPSAWRAPPPAQGHTRTLSFSTRCQVTSSQERPAGSSYILFCLSMHLPGGSDSKEPTCQYRRPSFDPWVGKMPWRRKWQPTPAFLPGESYGQRSLAGYSLWGSKSQTRLSN